MQHFPGGHTWQSQSPYRAKWFATTRDELEALRTYIMGSQSPYGAKWFATGSWKALAERLGLTQSPYGAKWFATLSRKGEVDMWYLRRNPLTGLSSLQRFWVEDSYPAVLRPVAIPLRG